MSLASAAKSSEVQQMEDMPEDGIELQYFFCHVVQINKQNFDGVNPAIRTVVFDRNGNMYGSTSEQIARDIYTLQQTVGTGEIPPGVFAKFESVKAGRGKVHKLVIQKR